MPLNDHLCRMAALRRLFARDTRGVALIEFAYTLPFVLLLVLGGMEVTNYALTHMRASQIAVSLADNASRAKEQSVTGTPQMREIDVNEAFVAAGLQAGTLDIANNGRLILSSLQVNGEGGQWVHWQRCFGETDHTSSYGEQGDGASGSDFPGMGPAGRIVRAEPGFAIMFAEVVVEYDPLFSRALVPDRPIRKHAAMYVRDDRDLSGIFNPAPAAPVRRCD